MEQRKSQTSGPRIVNAYVEPSSSKAGRFITLSMFVHAAMLATVSLMNFTPSEISKPDHLIEIEMTDGTESASFEDALQGESIGGGIESTTENTAVTDTTATTATAPAAVATAPTETPVKPAPPTSAPIAKLPQEKSSPKPHAQAVTQAPVPEAPTLAHSTEPEAPAVVPNESSQLEATETGDVPVSQQDAPTAKPDEADEDALAEAKKALQVEAAMEAAANDAALEEAKRNAEAKEAEALAAAEAQRQKDAEALAAAKAKEIAAAREARAQERAEAEARARAKAAAEASEAAAKSAAASKAAEVVGAGQGDSAGTTAGTTDQGGNSPEGAGQSEGTKQVPGIPGGVRSLGQLRRMPGGRLPTYEPRERLQRQEGSVVYYAYVNKDGSLSEFKLAKSTGYKNLDERTLAALRTWKFYPGQEGWVEMPFQWSLKGEAQEAGGLLR